MMCNATGSRQPVNYGEPTATRQLADFVGRTQAAEGFTGATFSHYAQIDRIFYDTTIKMGDADNDAWQITLVAQTTCTIAGQQPVWSGTAKKWDHNPVRGTATDDRLTDITLDPAEVAGRWVDCVQATRHQEADRNNNQPP
eukprot:m.36454 g.36454  ORF g.36454 m.36454 type:complete len:141 (-) comp11019_c0_seq1:581-1003(-)